MAENLVESVQSMLKEETWTRATISNYTQNNLKELANIVEQARNEGVSNEIQAICEEHLLHSKDSIIALYLSGILSLQKGSLDNTPLINLVDIFQKNHKENIVHNLCENIIAFDPNNKFALRTLASLYLTENNDQVWDLYKTIIKIDFEEADLVKTLAEHYDELGDRETAIDYYKKALLRYINASNYNSVKEIWAKLVEYIPTEFDFFQLAKRKISKSLGDIRTVTLMQELYNWYKEDAATASAAASSDEEKDTASAKWNIPILILKQNLEIEPKDAWARKELADCYRGKYAKHSNLEEYIKSSNLTQSYRNVFEAITDFEKHIAFDKGNYVFHNNWGVGLIKNLENDKLTINFGKKAGIKEISLKLAVTALKPLSKDHFWVYKATKKKETLCAMVKDKIPETLKIIIKSFDNNCDFKRIKAELVPGILTPGEWTSWNAKAKKILESDSSFGINPNDINMYTVRENQITPEEKMRNEFTAQKQFFARADILMKFFDSELTDNSSEAFSEMYSYFTGFLKNISHVTEQVIASYLIVKNLSTIDKQLTFQVKETFAELYSHIEDPRELYLSLKDTKNTSLRPDFLNFIKTIPTWNEEYIRLFPIVLDKKLINDLITAGHTDDVQKLVRNSFEHFKDYRETVLFFFKECQEDEWFKTAGVSYEKQLITLINLIELSYREINNHVNSTENKKLQKNALDLLFKNDTIFNYMFSNNEETVMKMYTLLDDIADLDTQYKEKCRSRILEKYPDMKFRKSEEKTTQNNGMIVTAQKLKEKKEEMDHLQNVLIPKNAEDVAEAKAKGDLKENQEYKSAREQQHFLNLELQKLSSELARAVIFDPTTVTTATISFGNKITVTNNIDGKDEVYTILGPWESDPDNNIISYMSPKGTHFQNHKVGDNLVFTVNGTNCDYTIKTIEKASI